MKKNETAFTLLELMIVIAILGVLAALISGNFITSLKKGRDARRKADLEQIQPALEMFYEDKKAYPTFNIFANENYALCETSINTTCGTGKTYMQKIPDDPVSGKTYEYDYDTSSGGYKLYACLENTQQILPYQAVLSPPGGLTCPTQCFAKDGTTKISCIYGISSPNTNP